MSKFQLDQFVDAARKAAAHQNPMHAMSQLMATTFAAPSEIRNSVPAMEQTESLLFEDQTVSIWHEKFLPEELIPPHDHQMPAFVGVYHGRECNRLYQHVGAKMLPAGDLILKAGEFHVFRPEEIHSVQALDGAPSLGLHVYLGPLSNCERSLFDWSTGAAVPMSEDAFNQMKRTV